MLTDFSYVMQCAIELSSAILEASRKMKEARVCIEFIEDECFPRNEISEEARELLENLKKGIFYAQEDNLKLEVAAAILRKDIIAEEKETGTSSQDDEED